MQVAFLFALSTLGEGAVQLYWGYSVRVFGGFGMHDPLLSRVIGRGLHIPYPQTQNRERKGHNVQPPSAAHN